jgi:hypothetical protein
MSPSFDGTAGAPRSRHSPARLVPAGLCPACLLTGSVDRACACATPLVPASAPSTSPIVAVALTALPGESAARLLDGQCTGPRRYPRPGQIGNGLACREHEGRSFWLLHAPWADLDPDHRASGPARGRLLRALAYSSHLLVELPPSDRMHQARHRVLAGRPLPSHLELVDWLRQQIQRVGVRPVALAAVASAPGDEVRGLLGRVCGNARVFGVVRDAMAWLVRQPRPGSGHQALGPVPGAPARTPVDGSCRIIVVDWGGDLGHRLVWGLHRDAMRARRQSSRAAVAPLDRGDAWVDTSCPPEAAACGTWALHFDPPPRGERPVPEWQGRFEWSAASVRPTAVAYDAGIGRADVIIAGVGHDATSAEMSFSRTLEFHWAHGVPILLLRSPRSTEAREPGPCAVSRWAADSFPGAPAATLWKGHELDVVAHAVSLAPLPDPEAKPGLDSQEGRAP